jgi:hypothetical protein
MKSDSDLIQALHRDVRWLMQELKRIRDAKALNADKLREIAAESLERAKVRSKRTLSME